MGMVWCMPAKPPLPGRRQTNKPPSIRQVPVMNVFNSHTASRQLTQGSMPMESSVQAPMCPQGLNWQGLPKQRLQARLDHAARPGHSLRQRAQRPAPADVPGVPCDQHALTNFSRGCGVVH